MTPRIERALVTVASLVLVAAGSGVAYAQVPPAPTLPPPPETPREAAPFVEGSESGVYFVCQNAGAGPAAVSSAASLASLALAIAGAPAVAVPTEVYGYVAITQYPCATAPVPGAVSECETDRQADGAVDAVYDATGAGFATVFAPVNLPKTGPLVDLVVALEALSEAYAAGVELPVSPAGTAYDTLGCRDVFGNLTTGLPEADPDAVTSTGTEGGGPSGSVDTPAALPFSQESVTPSASAGVGGSGGGLAAPAAPGITTGSSMELAGQQPVLEEFPISSTSDRWHLWRIGGIGAALSALVGLYLWLDVSRAATVTR